MSRIYTPEEHKFMEEFVPGHSHKEIREEFLKRFGGEVTKSFPGSYIKNHHLKTGRTGRFEKGVVPANKGKKVSPEVYEKIKGTMFKKGNKPQTTVPVGSESKKTTDPYVWVKVDDKDVPSRFNWRPKHHIVYEKHHGKIPDGCVVMFLDGDPKNLAPENLKAVDRSINSILNAKGLRFDDPDLTETGIYIAEVMAAVGKAKKKGKKNHQD